MNKNNFIYKIFDELRSTGAIAPGDIEFVDSIPATSVELKYYVSDETICTLYPNKYFVNGNTLYIKQEDGRYRIQRYTHICVALLLSDMSYVWSSMERLVDLMYQDEAYITELRRRVYKSYDSCEYYANEGSSSPRTEFVDDM